MNKFIFSQKSVYNSRLRLYRYSDDYYRLVYLKSSRLRGFEEIKKNKIVKDNDEVDRCSLSRTKRNIREYALCNDFYYFCTFTIADPQFRYDLDFCQSLLKKQFKKLKRKNSDLRYLFITEKHKDGAYHFHGLMSKIDDGFYVNKNNYLSNIYLDILGFNSFSVIKDKNKISNYITKYITKDCVKNKHNQIYFCSRNLKKADKFDIDLLKFNINDVDFSYCNDYVKIKDIKINEKNNEKLLTFLTQSFVIYLVI